MSYENRYLHIYIYIYIYVNINTRQMLDVLINGYLGMHLFHIMSGTCLSIGRGTSGVLNHKINMDKSIVMKKGNNAV